MLSAGNRDVMNSFVRKTGLVDVERLALIGAATFLETFAGILDGDAIVAHCKWEHSAATYAHHISSGATAWLAQCNLGNAPVGYALLGPTALPGSETGDLELKRIYLLSRYHGTGIGKALMDAAIDCAGSSGAIRLLLGVYVGNDRAIAFYRKQGFVRIADRRFKVGDHEYDDVVLARTLRH